MKKKILLPLALLISLVSVAQEASFGIGAGITRFNMRGNAIQNIEQLLDLTGDVISTRPTSGFYGGGYTNIPVGEIFSVEPGLYYSGKGYEIGGDYSFKGIGLLSAGIKTQLQTNYIDLPVLLKASFNGFQVFAGPQVSYLTRASLVTRAGIAGINLLNSSMDVSNQLNKWDAAVTGGIGYQFANGFRLSAAYEHGLVKADAGQNTQSFNQGIKIGAGFSF